jgi:hypothetical protein
MKHFIVWFETNYDLDMMLINANTEEDAKVIAENKNQWGGSAWQGYDIQELDLETLGVTFRGSQML